MHFYKLENKEIDRMFLEGSPVSCKAVVPEKDYITGKLEEGTLLVIILSNGKKYKGQIAEFICRVHDGVAEGELKVLRAT
ncbi:MAG TPA: hypothetical protein VFW11_09850 [Cyclobacteriaceae bacterium]|nr:hypothetical protein [Cyclobacteriaceae bacterium]